MDRVRGRGSEVRGQESRASVGCGLRAERRQRGGEHEHLGLHEGEVWQRGHDLSRLLAQVLLLPGLPVGNRKWERTAVEEAGPRNQLTHRPRSLSQFEVCIPVRI